VLIDRGRRPVRVTLGQQLFVVAAHGENFPHRNPVADLVIHAAQAFVEDGDLVPGVADDVGDVVGVQPGVDRVGDQPGDRRAVVDLGVLVMAPAQRAHPGARFQAQTGQRGGEAPGPASQVGVAVAVKRAVGQPGDHLTVAGQPLDPVQDGGDGELVVHDLPHDAAGADSG
jgi:hypothetical protein